MNDREKGMIQGLCLAAVYLKKESEVTLALEVLKAHGVDEATATMADVDSLDFKAIWGKSYGDIVLGGGIR